MTKRRDKMQGNCLSILDIIQGSTSVIGVIVSVVGIIISVWTARRSYRISLYERRKNSFDFFKDYIDDWRYFYDYRAGKDTQEIALLIALNGFSHDKLDELIELEKLGKIDQAYRESKYPYIITKGYNFQHRQLENLIMYFSYSKKRKEHINRIKSLMELYYVSLLGYFNTCLHNPEQIDESVEQLKINTSNFISVIFKEENVDIIKWMEKQLRIK